MDKIIIRSETMLGTSHSWAVTMRGLLSGFKENGDLLYIKSSNGRELIPNYLIEDMDKWHPNPDLDITYTLPVNFKTRFYKKLRQEFQHFKNILSPDVILPGVYASYNIKRHEIESKRHDMWYTNKLWIDRARSDISVDHHENWTEYQQENVFDDIINYE